MPNYVRVTNPENNLSWEKQLTNEELKQVRQFANGQSTVAILPAALTPVRTNNLINFSKDFFLPTFVNHAIKVENMVGKIFAIIGALFLDLITFPIRLLTCIPRLMSNPKKEQHPLYIYLQKNKVDSRIYESDYVKVRLGWETQYISGWQNNYRVLEEGYTTEQHWSEKNVNLIELPMHENAFHLAWGMH